MKIKFAILLAVFPVLLILVGATSQQLAKKFPRSESPSSLRQFIHGIQVNEKELTIREAEMLLALDTSAKELERFHEAFSAFKEVFSGGSGFLIFLGILQLIVVGIVYAKSKPEPVGRLNSESLRSSP